MFEKEVVIDGKDHLVGRLASIVAKELLSGQKIVVVRCDKLVKSGSLFRNKLAFHEFLNKTNTHNPRKWIVHYRAPSRIFWRTVRGMLPHKFPRGAAALGRLKVFDGCPTPYDLKKKKVVPAALRLLRLKNHRQWCYLGDLSSQVGWKQQSLVDKLEEKRKVRAKAFHERKLARVNLQRKAQNLPEFKALKEDLAKYGY